MGLSVAFDLPTQIGYDSDHAMAEGEVGKVGVPISTLNNIENLFKGILATRKCLLRGHCLAPLGRRKRITS